MYLDLPPLLSHNTPYVTHLYVFVCFVTQWAQFMLPVCAIHTHTAVGSSTEVWATNQWPSSQRKSTLFWQPPAADSFSVGDGMPSLPQSVLEFLLTWFYTGTHSSCEFISSGPFPVQKTALHSTLPCPPAFLLYVLLPWCSLHSQVAWEGLIQSSLLAL